MSRFDYLVITMMVIIVGVAFSFTIHTFMETEYEDMVQKIEQLEKEVGAQELQLEMTRELIKEVKSLRNENEALRERMKEWLDEWQVKTVEITHYAPLDPSAVDGWDYCGDPTITASGEQVEIGKTIAAGPSIPFGTRVYIPGYGMRVVQDRGGLIGDESIDIAIICRSEAFRLGRQTKTVIMERQG